MSKFITRLAPLDNGPRCRAGSVGESIRALSDLKASGAINEPINSSAHVSPKWENWKGTALDHAKAIVSGLCVYLLGDKSTLGPFSDPDDASQIQAKVKVRFVFEEEGELIIVIPHQSAIDHGLKDKPPLSSMDDYDNFSRKKVMKKARKKFKDEIKKLNLGPNEPKVLKVYEKVEDDNPDQGKEIPTFYTQLGEYSCRQCGH